jgi:hypothetical protein
MLPSCASDRNTGPLRGQRFRVCVRVFDAHSRNLPEVPRDRNPPGDARRPCAKMVDYGPNSLTHMPTRKLTHDIINAAIAGFEAQKRRIDDQIGELRHMLNPGSGTQPRQPAPTQRKWRLSAAGRRAMAEAARKRWAAVRATKAKGELAVTARRPGRKARKAKA